MLWLFAFAIIWYKKITSLPKLHSLTLDDVTNHVVNDLRRIFFALLSDVVPSYDCRLKQAANNDCRPCSFFYFCSK